MSRMLYGTYFEMKFLVCCIKCKSVKRPLEITKKMFCKKHVLVFILKQRCGSRSSVSVLYCCGSFI